MDESVPLVAVQRETSQALIALAVEIEGHQKKLDAAKLSFATTGAAGGIMAIVGLALTPVTFGASLGLTIAGGVVGGLSAAGNIGSLIADKVLTSKTLKKAQDQLIVLAHEDESAQKQLPALLAKLSGEQIDNVVKRIKHSKDINDETKKTLLERIKEWRKELSLPFSVATKSASVVRATTDVIDNIMTLANALSKSMEAGNTLQPMACSAGAAANAAKAGKAAAAAADAGLDVAKDAGKLGLSGFKIAGIAAAGVGLVFDLGGIVYYSIKVYKQKPCDVAEKIRRVAYCLM